MQPFPPKRPLICCPDHHNLQRGDPHVETPGYRDCLDYFNDVYDATYSDMLRYALVKARCAEGVEDLLQNTYAKFFRRIRQHGHADIGNPRAFLVTLLHKELARYYRFHAVRSEAELRQDLPPAAATQPAAETLGVTALTLSEVWDCVRSMPPLSQKVFLLYYGLDQPHCTNRPSAQSQRNGRQKPPAPRPRLCARAARRRRAAGGRRPGSRRAHAGTERAPARRPRPDLTRPAPDAVPPAFLHLTGPHERAERSKR